MTKQTLSRMVVACAALLCLAACGGGDDGGGGPAEPATITKEATLTLAQEVPAATAPAAANVIGGTMTVTLTTASNALSGVLTLTGDTARVTGAHIHDADVGASNPIPDILLQNDGGGRWSVPAGTTLSSTQEARFKAGGYYVNAHTELNAPGEIRGQLIGFSGNVQPIFTASCAVALCHVSGGSAPMSLTSGVSVANMVNVPAFGGGTRVIPGDSANSVLYKRVSGTSAGPLMPLGRAALTANQQNLLKVWIDMGAKDN